MVEPTKDPWTTDHLLEMIDKGRDADKTKEAPKKAPEPEWQEPMPAEADFAAYLKKIEANKMDMSVFFKPRNFAKFLNAGPYQTLSLPETETTPLSANMLFIVGCGRSGTTLMFNLIESTGKPETVSVKLDEPREFYLSFWSPRFDVWSCRSKEREGKLVPEVSEKSPSNFNKML